MVITMMMKLMTMMMKIIMMASPWLEVSTWWREGTKRTALKVMVMRVAEIQSSGRC